MKKLFFFAGFLCLISMLLPACAPSPEPEPAPEPVVKEAANTEADIAAIKKVIEDELAAAEVGDTNKQFACWTADIEHITPSRPARRGEQLRQPVQDEQNKTTFAGTYSNQEIVVDGDLAFHRYSYDIVLTPKGGEPTKESGAGIQILQRQQDGSWKISKDIWNSDSPPLQK